MTTPINLAALATRLTREGVESVTRLSPRDVSATLDRIGPVGVVFLDLEFPTCNGLTLIKELQADERLHDVPFVAYTVHISEEMKRGLLVFTASSADR